MKEAVKMMILLAILGGVVILDAALHAAGSARTHHLQHAATRLTKPTVLSVTRLK